MSIAIERIKQCMREKNVTQTDLARSMGEDVRVLNQQLVRQIDIKHERYEKIMKHLGYVTEVKDIGVRKIDNSVIDLAKAGKFAGDLFYAVDDEGKITGLKRTNDGMELEDFWTIPECFEWLIS